MAVKQTIAELLIEIGMDARDAERTADRIDKKLKGVKGSAEKAEKGVDGTTRSLKRFSKVGDAAGKVADTIGKVLLGVSTAMVGLGTQVITVGGRFEKLEARLKTTTGSAQGAQRALDFIRDFTKSTPFQLDQVTDAFVKLSNFGLDPTTRNLTAFGDFASAMGKSLDQLIEAVLDATTGEFERLKEFGIKTRQEGDKVSFTFRGITTEVDKNATDIQKFLVGLAETNFGGAMSEQMETLGGLTSNLQDAMAEFFNEVAQMGPLEEFKGLIGDLRDATAGQGGLAPALARLLTNAIKSVRRLMDGNLIPTLERVLKVVEFVVENFGKLAALFVSAKLISGIAGLTLALSEMGVTLTVLTGPIGIAIAGFAALTVAAIAATEAILGAQEAELRALGGPRAAKRGQTATPEQLKAATRQAKEDIGTLPGEDLPVRASDLSGLTEDELETLKAQSKSQAPIIARTEEDAIALEKRRVQQRLIDAELDQRETDRRKASDAALAKAAQPKKQKRKGTGDRKKKEKKVVSPVTVSEFFGAAARGELGQIADRTPSPREIEPTVAVDITNNNFSFNDTFNIRGAVNPTETGKQVVKQIRAEFDRRLAAAGQQLATNLER